MLRNFGTLATFALLGASVAYWGVRLAAPAHASVPADVVADDAARVPEPDGRALSALLGERAVPAAPVQSRYRLVGVIADARSGQWGAVLIADGSQAPQPYRAGAKLSDGSVVGRIERTRVQLERAGAAAQMLVLPEPPAAAAPGQPVPGL